MTATQPGDQGKQHTKDRPTDGTDPDLGGLIGARSRIIEFSSGPDEEALTQADEVPLDSIAMLF